MYSFIETRLFTRLVSEYLSDEEYRELQETLINDPGIGMSSRAPAAYGSFVGERPAEANAAATV